MTKAWLGLMLKRLGKACGIDNLHPHRFRHTYAVNWLRSGAPERVLMLNAGWKKKVPETYFRTVGMDDVTRFRKQGLARAWRLFVVRELSSPAG